MHVHYDHLYDIEDFETVFVWVAKHAIAEIIPHVNPAAQNQQILGHLLAMEGRLNKRLGNLRNPMDQLNNRHSNLKISLMNANLLSRRPVLEGCLFVREVSTMSSW